MTLNGSEWYTMILMDNGGVFVPVELAELQTHWQINWTPPQSLLHATVSTKSRSHKVSGCTQPSQPPKVLRHLEIQYIQYASLSHWGWKSLKWMQEPKVTVILSACRRSSWNDPLAGVSKNYTPNYGSFYRNSRYFKCEKDDEEWLTLDFRGSCFSDIPVCLHDIQ